MFLLNKLVDQWRRIFTSCILFVGFFGVLSPFEYNVLPSTVIFELLFLLSSVIFICYKQKDFFRIISLFFALYFVFSFIYAVFIVGANYLDVVQAFKAFIYISLFSAFLNKRIFELKSYEIFYKILVVIFLIKYCYSRIFSLDEIMSLRPGVFDENNFELVLLILMLVPLKKFNSSSFNVISFFVFFLVILSGSRSASVAFIFCMFFLHFSNFNRRSIFAFLFLPIAIYLIYLMFDSRMSGNGYQEIDRFKLLNFFLYEVDGWGFFDFLFGAERITPLSDATCLSLPYYESLFSRSGNNSCYSVILHSYLLRVIFDHGILLFFMMNIYLYKIVLNAKYDLRYFMAIFMSMISSALSVSAYNSVYFALGMIFILTVYSEKDSY